MIACRNLMLFCVYLKFFVIKMFNTISYIRYNFFLLLFFKVKTKLQCGSLDRILKQKDISGKTGEIQMNS